MVSQIGDRPQIPQPVMSEPSQIDSIETIGAFWEAEFESYSNKEVKARCLKTLRNHVMAFKEKVEGLRTRFSGKQLKSEIRNLELQFHSQMVAFESSLTSYEKAKNDTNELYESFGRMAISRDTTIDFGEFSPVDSSQSAPSDSSSPSPLSQLQTSAVLGTGIAVASETRPVKEFVSKSIKFGKKVLDNLKVEREYVDALKERNKRDKEFRNAQMKRHQIEAELDKRDPNSSKGSKVLKTLDEIDNFRNQRKEAYKMELINEELRNKASQRVDEFALKMSDEEKEKQIKEESRDLRKAAVKVCVRVARSSILALPLAAVIMPTEAH